MDLKTIMLIALALAPAIVLLIFIYKKDRVEKEPIGLLLLLFGLGVVSTFFAGEIEEVIISLIDRITINVSHVDPDGTIYFSWFGYKVYQFFKFFIGVALVEEGLKWIILFFVTRKNKNFNCYFDGIIYAVFVSLGFAAFENVLYVLKYGFETGVSRALLSVPGHMFFAVFMGMFYTAWHEKKKAYEFAERLEKKGYLKGESNMLKSNKMLFLSILVPVLLHGFYDFAISLSISTFWQIAFYAFVIILYIVAFKYISKKSKADGFDELYSVGLVVNAYPGLVILLDTPDEQINDEDVKLVKKYLVGFRRKDYPDQVDEIGEITKDNI